MVANIYVVAALGRADVFTESRNRQLDYFRSLPLMEDSDAELRVRAAVHEIVNADELQWYEFEPVDPVRHAVWFRVTQPTVRLYGLARPDRSEFHSRRENPDLFGGSDPLVAFLIRYRTYRACMVQGDYLSVASMLMHSEKLKPHVSLVATVEDSWADMPLVMKYLHDSEASRRQLRQSLEGRRIDLLPSGYHRLLSVCTKLSAFDDIKDFDAQATALMLERLDQGTVRIPVAGLQFHQHALQILGNQLRIITEESVRLHLSTTTGCPWDPRQLEKHVEQLLPVSVNHEPCNAHDLDAMAIQVRALDGSLLHVGYVKRPLARILHASNWKFAAAIAWYDDEELEIDIWRLH